MFELFADLIARGISDGFRREAAENALGEERAAAELREQFIAVLAHDLRAPVRGMNCFIELLVREQLTGRSCAEWHKIISRQRPSHVQSNRVYYLDLARSSSGQTLALQIDARSI